MEEVAEVEVEVVEVVGVVVDSALPGHLGAPTQAGDHQATRVIGVEFTTIILIVPVI